MRGVALIAAIVVCSIARAMPLGLRTAMWSIASSQHNATEDATVLPELGEYASAQEIVAAFAGFADSAILQGTVTNAMQYADYREWAFSVKDGTGNLAGVDVVKLSPYAAVSYFLGAEVLLQSEPVIGISDVDITEEGEGGLKDTTITLSVTVTDGQNDVAVASEKVATMFEATSNLGEWESEASKLVPTVEILGNDGNAMRFKVKPGVGTANSAFLRIRR